LIHCAQLHHRGSAVARVDLWVPYADKDEVKQLGGRWDATTRTWYVPEELAVAPFTRWLPVPPAPNVRAPGYFLAASSHACRRCGAIGAVHGFMLPADHETLLVNDDDTEAWERAFDPTLLSYIDWLAPAVAARMTALTPHYRMAYSRFPGGFYWMNFCEHCSAPLGDHETFAEPGEGFLAFTLEDARRITLRHVPEPFLASCGSYSIGVSLFRQMRRA
jgi:hypothetical protein